MLLRPACGRSIPTRRASEAAQKDGDEQLGAPAGDVYQSHSGDIMETLADLLEKAEDQLEALRKQE